MSSNLRSKPVEGYVTDSAGNILRNSIIIVKQETPSGSKVIESTKSDDAGFYSTNPIPNGTYDIYESGIVVSRIIHRPDHNSIQCFKADVLNYKPSTVGDFTTLAEGQLLNSYRIFIQIETPSLDISRFGSSFPIYDFNILQSPDIAGSGDELLNMANFLSLDPSSRITTTRFDVEYYAPLTNASSNYKRIRWAGVPAIRFSSDSKLVIPLDYFSIVANYPKIIDPVGNDTYQPNSVIIQETGSGASISDSSNEIESLSQNTNVGDILRVSMSNGFWYGVISSIEPGSPNQIFLELWKSSRFPSEDIISQNVSKIMAFDGMFNGINDIDESVNERFKVVENISAQNNETELYNYNNA